MKADTPIGCQAAREQSQDVALNPTDNPTIGDVIARRFDRRDLVRGVLGVTAVAATLGPKALAAAPPATTPSFDFQELRTYGDVGFRVARGYDAQVLVRWGDPIAAGGPAFDPYDQSAAKQSRQFGYNNDYVGYFPLDGSSEHGLLCINHEYTNEELMFPGAAAEIAASGDRFGYLTRERSRIEQAAHGGTVIEIAKSGGSWTVVLDSPYNRRITALDTIMVVTGPAAGHPRLRTAGDPTGTRIRGTINNCAGGQTPWGTWLAAEENFQGYFTGALTTSHPEYRNYARYGVGFAEYGWGLYESRWDIEKEPNAANRYGWMVEIDPYDPTRRPKKRTALGRFKHEGAESILNKDGRVVVYMGDDQRFDYVYKFVSAERYKPDAPRANQDLLDEGTLFVARFNADGTLEWLPIVFGEGPLTPANDFASQADVLIETRRAADLLGATKMDRPEDVEPNPVTGKVYAIMTNNTSRTAGDVDPANPRGPNPFGHIIEMTPPGGDHGATAYTWNILVTCGDPSIAEVGATFSAATSNFGWFANPDNCAIDGEGRLWIATDGNNPGFTGRQDGLWALETDGAARGTAKCFAHVPLGAEMCGPKFTPDTRTLFLAVQHPGESNAAGVGGTFEAPPTRWPDFDPALPPRPSVVVVTKQNGGKIA